MQNVGKIDLPGLFAAEHERLNNAVRQGAVLHRTKNLRDAGAKLELEFRDFLGVRLPPRFRVQSGYLFDAQSQCTPQIDAMIVDGDQAHELMRSEGAVYLPYPSGVAVFEIKNSAAKVKATLAQLSTTIASIKAMRDRAKAAQVMVAPDVEVSVDNRVVAVSNPESKLLSALIIGRTGNISVTSMKVAYGATLHPPDYLLLLDKGLLITRSSEYFVSEKLPFRQFRLEGSFGIYTSASPRYPEGCALLWLYAAIADHLNLVAHGGKGHIHPFTNQIADDFPMVLKARLSTAAHW